MASNKTKRRKGRASPRPKQYQAVTLDSYRNSVDTDWRFADSKSIGDSLTYAVREKVKNRAQYELLNNAYCASIATTLAQNVCPAVPRINLIPYDNEQNDILNRIEDDWLAWVDEICLDEKIRQMRISKFVSGESFAILHTDNQLFSDVKLNLSEIDSSRVTSGNIGDVVDGIKLDADGRVDGYYVINNLLDEPSYYRADRILHWAKLWAPGQYRGVSEMAPSLVLFAYLRRYIYAVVKASETAADVAFIMSTNDEDVTQADSDDLLIETSFSRGTSLTLPAGFQASQLKAEQPTTGFSSLVDEILGAIGASLGLPRLITRKSAVGFNYSSSKCDTSAMEGFIAIERRSLETSILRPLFLRWLAEWKLVNQVNVPRFKPEWATPESLSGKLDPLKEANAISVKLKSGLTSYQREYGKLGLDWEQELTQITKEKALRRKLRKEYGLDDA